MPASQLTSLLDTLIRGDEPPAGQLAILSGLDAPDLAEVITVWGSIPARLREHVLDQVTGLADENFDLDFHGIARQALYDDDPAVRRSAIAALWEDVAPSTGVLVAGLLRDAVRARAAESLRPFVLGAELGSVQDDDAEAILGALRGAATNPAEPVDVRAGAVESLGCRSLPWVETIVTDAYYSDDRRLRLAGIRAMGFSANEKWIEYLEEDLASDDPEVRVYAAGALEEIASTEAVDALGQALTDEDRAVQLAAISALREIGGEEAIRYLTEYAEEAPADLQHTIARAIHAARHPWGNSGGGSLFQR